MKNAHETRRINLRSLLVERFHNKQTLLAQAVGYERSMISRLLSPSPKTRQNIGNAMARTIERELHLPENWLDTPREPLPLAVAEALAKYNVNAGPHVQATVPLVSWVTAGQWTEVQDPFPAGDGEKWVPTTAHVGRRAYALRIVGDSMTNPTGSPSFPEGMIIVVDPDISGDHGRFVVVRQNHDAECTFKQLVRDGNRSYLRPLNPRYPVMELAPDAVICGVLVQAVMDF